MRLIFLIGVLASVGLFALIVEFSRRDLLDRTSFFIGLTAAIGIGFFSLMPGIMRSISDILGVEYTYVFTSTAGILTLLGLNIYTLARLVGTQRRLNNLSQEVALQD